jgi:O-antigen/teichoic acid export membrane protein
MPEEGSSARLVRNTLANGAGQFLAIVISLALTPFLIDGLGIAAYGVFSLALSLTFFGGYAALADLGVEGAAVRYVAEARSEGDHAAVDRTISTAAAFFTVMAILLTVPLVGLSHVLVDLFGIHGALRSEARACFALVACQLLFDLPSRAFFAVLEGAQRFTVWQAIEVARALLQGALFITVLALDLGIRELAGAMVLSSAGVLVLAVTFARRAMPELQVRPSLCSREVLRRLMTFGGGLLALRVMGTLYRQMDKVIIGTVLGVRFVTPYDVANKIHAGAATVQSVASSALLPATAFARNKADVLRDMYLRGSSYTVAVTLPVIVAGFIFAAPLIRTWVGAEIEREATSATRWFFVYLLIVLLHVVGVSILVGLGKMRPVLAVSFGVLVVNLGLSIALVRPLGIDGVVIGTVVANGLAFPVMLVILLRQFELGLGEWFHRIVWPNLPGVVAQAATAPPLLWLAARADNVAEAGGVFLISVGVSLATFFLAGVPRPERDVLVATIRAALGLRPSVQKQ